jgi:hypothetical protein
MTWGGAGVLSEARHAAGGTLTRGGAQSHATAAVAAAAALHHHKQGQTMRTRHGVAVAHNPLPGGLGALSTLTCLVARGNYGINR